MINNIVFDFDGTLIDSKRMYVELIKKAFSEMRIEIPIDKIDKELIPSIKGTIETVIPRELDRRDELTIKIEQRIIELTSSDGLNYISLANNAPEVLKDLKNEDKTIFLLSNSHSSFINQVLNSFNLHPYFDQIITLDSGFPSKLEALKDLAIINNFEPGEIIYIGDTRNDIKLAKEFGCKIIIILHKFSWDFNEKSEILELNPDFVIEKLYDLIPILKQMGE